MYSNGDKTITISLKSSYTWSNGQPITANDTLFFIDLVKAGDQGIRGELGELRARPLPG